MGDEILRAIAAGLGDDFEIKFWLPAPHVLDSAYDGNWYRRETVTLTLLDGDEWRTKPGGVRVFKNGHPTQYRQDYTLP